MNTLVKKLLLARKDSWSVTEAVQEAVSACGLGGEQTRQDRLSVALWSVVNAVEVEGARLGEMGRELAYHNRSHIVDAVTSLSCLMMATPNLSEAGKWVGLIAMVGHDLGHQGKTNQQLQSNQEKMTADWVVRSCLSGLPLDVCEQVRRLIELTDPAMVRANHFAYRKKADDEALLLQVLVNEADIAASLVPQLSLGLTRCLLLERGNLEPTHQEVVALYSEFKKECILSSVAAELLLSSQSLASP